METIDRRKIAYRKRKKLAQKKYPSILTKVLCENKIEVKKLSDMSGIPTCVLYRYLDNSRKVTLENAYKIVHVLHGLITFPELIDVRVKIKIDKEIEKRNQFINMIY